MMRRHEQGYRLPGHGTGERRTHERFPVRTSAACAGVSPWIAVALDDLSTSGARFRAPIRPPIGSFMLVTVAPDALATGTVVRHTRDGFAVAFRPLDVPPTGEDD